MNENLTRYYYEQEHQNDQAHFGATETVHELSRHLLKIFKMMPYLMFFYYILLSGGYIFLIRTRF